MFNHVSSFVVLQKATRMQQCKRRGIYINNGAGACWNNPEKQESFTIGEICACAAK